MKILLSSYAFYPNIGGIESVSELLANEFVRLGHEVRVITQTPGADREEWKFEVLRKPSARGLLRAVQWCDLFFQNNISLQSLWPLLLVRRPWVVTHQTWISRLDRSFGWQDYLKRFFLRAATNVSISRAIAKSLPVGSEIIPNPYRDDLFYPMPEVAREKDLVFLGRLVSDKGTDLLVEAVHLLKESGLTVSLTVIGSGPEEMGLKAQAKMLGVASQMDFVGPKSGVELAQLLNGHRVLAVPSRWAEPFGIVALEGIACGCVVVGSQEGGLPDAIGPCGLTFSNGSAPELAAAIRESLTDAGRLEQLRVCAQEHLAHHTARAVAAAYLEIFQRVLP
ncbi:MAG: glycosyltransferase family 4 protein [Verrucomicrobia bacterium]|nr:glycosyltransferase family 4 protein [Verrucomicrobiota bacterium]